MAFDFGDLDVDEEYKNYASSSSGGFNFGDLMDYSEPVYQEPQFQQPKPEQKSWWSSFKEHPFKQAGGFAKDLALDFRNVMAKGAGATADVASYMTPYKYLKATGSGLNQAFRHRNNGESMQEAFQRGQDSVFGEQTFYEKAKQWGDNRDLLFRKTGDEQYYMPELSGNWGQRAKQLIGSKEGREMITAPAEAALNVYAGAGSMGKNLAGNLGKRILQRTARVAPEATAFTGLQAVQEGNLKDAPKNFVANILTMSVLGNVIGELTYKKSPRKIKRKVNETAKELEQGTGKKVSQEDKDAIASAFDAGASEEQIMNEVKKVESRKPTTFKPGELAPKVKEIQDEIGTLSIKQHGEIKNKLEQGWTPEDIVEDIRNPKPVIKPVEVKTSKKPVKKPIKKETKKATPKKSTEPKTDLQTEAKKYKTADEFIKGQLTGNEKSVNTIGIKTGEPVMLKSYHGTNAKFDKFKLQKGGVNYSGDGHYFTPEKTGATEYGKNVKEVILDLKNPYVKYLPEGNIDQQFFELAKEVKRKGHDGMIIRMKDTVSDDWMDGKILHKKGTVEADLINEIVVFDENAIKTKSQLKEIWNKANTPVKKTPKKKQTPKQKIKPTPKESVTAKKLNETLPDNYKLNTDYDTIELKNELTKASKAITKDKEKAVKDAFDSKKSVTSRIARLTELAEIAKRDGNMETRNSLFAEIRSLATESAQGMNMLKGLYAVNPENKFMTDVVNARLKKIVVGTKDIAKAKKQLAEKTTRVVKDITAKTRKAYKVADAQEMLNKIMCK